LARGEAIDEMRKKRKDKKRKEEGEQGKSLDEEASSLHASNAERSQQLQGEAGLFKSATAAQECVCTIAAALD
jgi:CDP-glycerol glycerophosphotransferase (TagB/SpsB family)